MTLDSNIINKQYFNPQISRVKNLTLSADGVLDVSKPSTNSVQLKVTRPFIVIDAQGEPKEQKVGSILWASPTADNKIFIFTTEGKKYTLILGENAEIYSKSKSENKKGGILMILGIALGAYVIYNLFKK